MERLSGTRYSYRKTAVAYLVPFIFLVPGGIVLLIIYLLNSPDLFTGESLAGIPTGLKIVAAILLALGIYVARDLWKTFLRTVSEEIWITDRDILWVGRRRRILVQSPHSDILRIVPVGGDFDHAWIYRIETSHGNIRFTRGLEHSQELIDRILRFLEFRS